MAAVFIVIAGIATALAASKYIWRAALTTGDLAIGLVSGLIGLTLARLFSGDSWGIGLPLFVACAAALALSALRKSPTEPDTLPEIYDGQTRRLDRWARR